MRQSVFAAAKARFASFFARFGLSLSQAAGIGAGVCVFIAVGAVLVRRRWLQQRQLALERRRASLASKQVLVIGSAKSVPAGANVAFENPLPQRPHEGRVLSSSTTTAHATMRTSTKVVVGRGRTRLGALGLPPPATRRAPDVIEYRVEEEEEDEEEEENAAAARGHARHSHRFAAAPLVAGRFSAAAAAAAAATATATVVPYGGDGGGGVVASGSSDGEERHSFAAVPQGSSRLDAAPSTSPPALRHAVDDADDWLEVVEEDGDVYWDNQRTNEMTRDEPPSVATRRLAASTRGVLRR